MKRTDRFRNARTSTITQEELKRHFYYDPENGIIKKLGKEGQIRKQKRQDAQVGGYRIDILINGCYLAAPTFIAIYHYGFYPSAKEYRIYFVSDDQTDLRINNIKFIKKTFPLTKEYLKEIINYNADTGDVTWNYPLRRDRSLKAENHSSGNNYKGIEIDHKNYAMHRIIWLYMTGEWPPENMVIDHINGDGFDNRWCNLRLATHSQNSHNRKPPSSMYRGVTFSKSVKKWSSSITVNKVRHHLGYFEDEKEAALAYNEASRRLCDGFGYENKEQV